MYHRATVILATQGHCSIREYAFLLPKICNKTIIESSEMVHVMADRSGTAPLLTNLETEEAEDKQGDEEQGSGV
jgi:hypothetical protein